MSSGPMKFPLVLHEKIYRSCIGVRQTAPRCQPTKAFVGPASTGKNWTRVFRVAAGVRCGYRDAQDCPFLGPSDPFNRPVVEWELALLGQICKKWFHASTQFDSLVARDRHSTACSWLNGSMRSPVITKSVPMSS